MKMQAGNIFRLLLAAVFLLLLPQQVLLADDYERKLPGRVMGADGNGRSWTGLDLGTPHVIFRVGWQQKADTEEQGNLILGLFEGSNREDFMDAIPLYMITEETVAGDEFSYAGVMVSRGFRYVRWCAPANTNCDIAEVEFYGYESDGDDNRFYQITNLPTLSYHTYSGLEPYDKVHELESEMCIIYDGGTRIQEYPVLARERGNGSRYELFKKRPYRIKFNDGKSHRMFKDSPLESPAKAKKWTLIPNWRDKSLMRNNVAFEMSRRLGACYTPWIQNVDVIVNGEYKGNYQLCDQVTVGRGRVDITEMTAEDTDPSSITGGYLLEITSPGETYHFTSGYGIPIDIKSPDEDDIAPQQFSYIQNAWSELEAHLWADNYQQPEKGYLNYLDLESFLRHFLVGEFAGNNDAMWSIYLYKERDDDLFRFGPVWDFDLSMDNDSRSYPANGKPDWLYNYGSAVGGIRSFVSRILSDPYALDRLSSIWSCLRKSGAFSQDSLWAFVDSLGVVMDESQKLNFTRWKNLGELLTLQQFAPGTYQGELGIIKNYLKERIRWIDKKLGYMEYDDDYVHPSDTLFAINSPQDFLVFQRAVNYQGLTSLSGRLEADIDLSSVTHQMEPIGVGGNPYVGCFDGQGHTISGLTLMSGGNYVGLFGVVGGGAVIKNFVLDETCSISGNAFVGIIGGSNGSGTVTMECLGNEGTVTALAQNAGGIFGCNMAASATPIFRNCYVTGAVKGGKESGQITGYAANGQAYNCYACGSIEGVYYKDMSDAMLRGKPRSFNCYSTYPDRNATVVDEEQICGGELCYMLSEGNDVTDPVWYQTLGEDSHPVLNATHAKVLLSDDGTYINEDDGTLLTPLWARRAATYSLLGIRETRFGRGIHIVRTRDGRSYKVLKK